MTRAEIEKKLEDLSQEIKKYHYEDNEDVYWDDKFETRCMITRRIADCIHALEQENYEIDLNQELSLTPLL